MGSDASGIFIVGQTVGRLFGGQRQRERFHGQQLQQPSAKGGLA